MVSAGGDWGEGSRRQRSCCTVAPTLPQRPVEYLNENPNASVVTPLGPRPLRVRLTLNSLPRRRVEWLTTAAGPPRTEPAGGEAGGAPPRSRRRPRRAREVGRGGRGGAVRYAVNFNDPATRPTCAGSSTRSGPRWRNWSASARKRPARRRSGWCRGPTSAQIWSGQGLVPGSCSERAGVVFLRSSLLTTDPPLRVDGRPGDLLASRAR